MAEIKGSSTATGNFPPLVGIRQTGNFVKGTVTEVGTTRNGNPAVTLALIDMDGSTSISVGEGKYQEVAVAAGDLVQIVGSVADLREKLPGLKVGDLVTITHHADKPVSFIDKKTGKKVNGAKQIYKVMVD